MSLIFRRGPGGALLCDSPVEGITQRLDDDTTKFYGGRYMVGETITASAAVKLAEILGGRLEDKDVKTKT